MSRGGPSNRHQAARPDGLPTRGFYRALREHCNIVLGQKARFYPDAFEFNVDSKTLTLHEIEVTHALTDEKLEKLRFLRACLASQGWSMRLMHGDSWGNRHEIDPDTGRMTDAEWDKAINRLRESGVL